jgi:gas vesicle protein
MTQKRNNKLYFLAGAVLGGLSAYYLMTPEGKKMRKNIADKTSEMADTITEKASYAVEEVNSMASDSLEKIKQTADSVKSNFDINTSGLNVELTDVVNDSLNKIEQGVKAARQKIKNGVA